MTFSITNKESLEIVLRTHGNQNILGTVVPREYFGCSRTFGRSIRREFTPCVPLKSWGARRTVHSVRFFPSGTIADWPVRSPISNFSFICKTDKDQYRHPALRSRLFKLVAAAVPINDIGMPAYEFATTVPPGQHVTVKPASSPDAGLPEGKLTVQRG